MRPTNTEIIVGESVVLPCQVACDPALEASFSWAFNGQLIDFRQDIEHFERVGGVSHPPLSPVPAGFIFVSVRLFVHVWHVKL